MKTKEFERKLDELGYNLKIHESYYNITFRDPLETEIASVSKNEVCVLNTDSVAMGSLKESHGEELFNLIVEYASTPIKDREGGSGMTNTIPVKIRMKSGHKFNSILSYDKELSVDETITLFFSEAHLNNKLLKLIIRSVEGTQEIYLSGSEIESITVTQDIDKNKKG